jgi:hypothetical protein
MMVALQHTLRDRYEQLDTPGRRSYTAAASINECTSFSCTASDIAVVGSQMLLCGVVGTQLDMLLLRKPSAARQDASAGLDTINAVWQQARTQSKHQAERQLCDHGPLRVGNLSMEEGPLYSRLAVEHYDHSAMVVSINLMNTMCVMTLPRAYELLEGVARR